MTSVCSPIPKEDFSGRFFDPEETLATHTPNAQPVCAVPARCWQAAKPLGEYSMVGCTVGPGFDFQDFEMISEGSAVFAHINSLDTALADLI